MDSRHCRVNGGVWLGKYDGGLNGSHDSNIETTLFPYHPPPPPPPPPPHAPIEGVSTDSYVNKPVALVLKINKASFRLTVNNISASH